jgi:hypothetical protein
VFATLTTAQPSSWRALTFTVPPSGVYFAAFSTRFCKTSITRRRSAFAINDSGSSSSTRMSRSLTSACKSSSAAAISGLRSISSASSASRPASAWARSSKSSISAVSRRVCCRSTAISDACGPVRPVSRERWSSPARSTATGVLSWWEASAENRVADSYDACKRSKLRFSTSVSRAISSFVAGIGKRSCGAAALIRSAAALRSATGATARRPSQWPPMKTTSPTTGNASNKPRRRSFWKRSIAPSRVPMRTR